MTDVSAISERKTRVLADILAQFCPAPRDILVVGCGDGQEAGILARYFAAKTVGIDLSPQSPRARAAAAPAELLEMDAQQLSFPDGSFDLVYSFHALEHIASPGKALSEMTRVLRFGGAFCVGTPNKQRLVGYVGAPASLADKVSWNLSDWRMRVTGRWENARGAHAGFHSAELLAMCREHFGDATEVSDRYYRQLYARHAAFLNPILATSLKWLILPCCYTIGIKQRSAAATSPAQREPASAC